MFNQKRLYMPKALFIMATLLNAQSVYASQPEEAKSIPQLYGTVSILTDRSIMQNDPLYTQSKIFDKKKQVLLVGTQELLIPVHVSSLDDAQESGWRSDLAMAKALNKSKDWECFPGSIEGLSDFPLRLPASLLGHIGIGKGNKISFVYRTALTDRQFCVTLEGQGNFKQSLDVAVAAYHRDLTERARRLAEQEKQREKQAAAQRKRKETPTVIMHYAKKGWQAALELQSKQQQRIAAAFRHIK